MEDDPLKIPYSFSKSANALLVNDSDAMVKIVYADDVALNLPIIGPRPPYYAHPRYEGHYPLI
ncbi:hypothetical protein COHCIP112018_02536 [Cohnella sp. JJ-181]|nr:hypothetical protein COHCIP112018_02536 [Cohnella sp. JJ-181]